MLYQQNKRTPEWSQIVNGNTACPGAPYTLEMNFQFKKQEKKHIALNLVST